MAPPRPKFDLRLIHDDVAGPLEAALLHMADALPVRMWDDVVVYGVPMEEVERFGALGGHLEYISPHSHRIDKGFPRHDSNRDASQISRRPMIVINADLYGKHRSSEEVQHWSDELNSIRPGYTQGADPAYTDGLHEGAHFLRELLPPETIDAAVHLPFSEHGDALATETAHRWAQRYGEPGSPMWRFAVWQILERMEDPRVRLSAIISPYAAHDIGMREPEEVIADSLVPAFWEPGATGLTPLVQEILDVTARTCDLDERGAILKARYLGDDPPPVDFASEVPTWQQLHVAPQPRARRHLDPHVGRFIEAHLARSATTPRRFGAGIAKAYARLSGTDGRPLEATIDADVAHDDLVALRDLLEAELERPRRLLDGRSHGELQRLADHVASSIESGRRLDDAARAERKAEADRQWARRWAELERDGIGPDTLDRLTPDLGLALLERRLAPDEAARQALGSLRWNEPIVPLRAIPPPELRAAALSELDRRDDVATDAPSRPTTVVDDLDDFTGLDEPQAGTRGGQLLLDGHELMINDAHEARPADPRAHDVDGIERF